MTKFDELMELISRNKNKKKVSKNETFGKKTLPNNQR